MAPGERFDGVNAGHQPFGGFNPAALINQFSQEVAAEIGLNPERLAARLASPLTRQYEQQTHTGTQQLR